MGANTETVVEIAPQAIKKVPVKAFYRGEWRTIMVKPVLLNGTIRSEALLAHILFDAAFDHLLAPSAELIEAGMRWEHEGNTTWCFLIASDREDRQVTFVWEV